MPQRENEEIYRANLKIYTKIYRVPKSFYYRLKDNIYNLLNLNAELGLPVNITLLFRSPLTMKETLSLPDYQPLKDFPHKVEFNLDFDSWRGNIKQEDLLPGMKLRPLSKLKKEPCYWLYDGPIIFADGKVGLCGCRDFNADSELIIGHILEASLLDLWQSWKTKGLRNRFWKGDFPLICRQCTTYADLTFYRTQEGLKRAEFLNEEITNLLNNAGQGFLSFGKDLKINEGFSRECLNIFNTLGIFKQNISD